MKREWFKAGDTITTLEGYIKINHINDAGLAWADEYIDTEDGDPEYSGELMLTASDIARRMNDYDGKAHSVVLDRSTEEDDEMNSIDSKTWDAIASYMDDDIREDVHLDMAPCSNEEFLREYLKRDPGFAEILRTEFNMEV